MIVTYLSTGGKVGDRIQATAVCEKSTRLRYGSCFLRNTTARTVKLTHSSAVGKTLAFTTITFRNEKGELAARGSHTKCADITLQRVHLQIASDSRYVAQAWGAHPSYTAPAGVVEKDDVELTSGETKAYAPARSRSLPVHSCFWTNRTSIRSG